MKAMAFGTFDYVHPGHIHYLKEAKKFGYLTIVIARDETVKRIKGVLPKYDEKKRLEDIKKLGIADNVILGDLNDPYRIIKEIMPEILCFGYDQRSFTDNIEAKLKELRLDIKIVRLEPFKPDLYKSSLLKNRKFAIIVSEKDMAGMNIMGLLLKELVPREEGRLHGNALYSADLNGKPVILYTYPSEIINYEKAAEEFGADFFIFPSKHKSKSGEKTLSVHYTGNFSDAEYGGSPKELSAAPAILMKQAFMLLNELGNGSGYDITMEATHHGPLLNMPLMFIEIGSLESEWQDKIAGSIIAKTILNMIKAFHPEEYEIAIGFGGTHYCTNFNKIELHSKIALGHICPKYQIENLTKELIIKMINTTMPKANFALLDWKGMNSAEKEKLTGLLEELKLPWKKISQIDI